MEDNPYKAPQLAEPPQAPDWDPVSFIRIGFCVAIVAAGVMNSTDPDASSAWNAVASAFFSAGCLLTVAFGIALVWQTHKGRR